MQQPGHNIHQNNKPTGLYHTQEEKTGNKTDLIYVPALGFISRNNSQDEQNGRYSQSPHNNLKSNKNDNTETENTIRLAKILQRQLERQKETLSEEQDNKKEQSNKKKTSNLKKINAASNQKGENVYIYNLNNKSYNYSSGKPPRKHTTSDIPQKILNMLSKASHHEHLAVSSSPRKVPMDTRGPNSRNLTNNPQQKTNLKYADASIDPNSSINKIHKTSINDYNDPRPKSGNFSEYKNRYARMNADNTNSHQNTSQRSSSYKQKRDNPRGPSASYDYAPGKINKNNIYKSLNMTTDDMLGGGGSYSSQSRANTSYSINKPPIVSDKFRASQNSKYCIERRSSFKRSVLKGGQQDDWINGFEQERLRRKLDREQSPVVRVDIIKDELEKLEYNDHLNRNSILNEMKAFLRENKDEFEKDKKMKIVKIIKDMEGELDKY